MSEHELISVLSSSPPSDYSSLNLTSTSDHGGTEEYGRGKRTMQIDYKRLAGEAYSYDSSEELMYHSFAAGSDDSSNNATKTFTKSNMDYANKHVPQLLFRTYGFDENTPAKENTVVQTLHDGAQLTVENLVNPDHALSIHRPILVTDTAESIGMKVPRGKTTKKVIKIQSDVKNEVQGDGDGDGDNKSSTLEENLSSSHTKIYSKSDPITIREIGEKIGMDHPVSVMDVKTQDEMEGWIISDLVEYFEDEDRLYQIRQYNHNSLNGHSRQKKKCQPLKASKPRVLNQISLEFSNTVLKKFTMSPAFVRELDWIDTMWPTEKRYDEEGNDTYPRVQYYCLTSTAGCYTDFHIDFGGTSVWYHVLSGKKVFLLIPPTKQNVALYESWLCSKHQPDIFFPDMEEEVVQNEGADNKTKTTMKVDSCVRVALEQNQTFVIPTGWIHAVYTPVDSIVIGGNFLHGFDIGGQLNIHCLETRTRVPAKFRFPFFIQLMFYAGTEYYKRLVEPYGYVREEEVKGLKTLIDALRSWSVGPGGDVDRSGSIASVMQDCVAELHSYGIRSMGDLLDELDGEVKRIEANGCVKRPSLDTKENNSNTIDATSEVDIKASSKQKLKLSLKRSTPTTMNNLQSDKAEVNDVAGDDFGASKLDEGKTTSTKSKRQKIGDLSSKQHVVDDDEWLPGRSNQKSKGRKQPKTGTQRGPDKIKSRPPSGKNKGKSGTAGKARKSQVRNKNVGRGTKSKQSGSDSKSRLRKKLGM